MKSHLLRSRVAESRFAAFFALGPRALLGAKHLDREARLVARWLAKSKEHTNFTYELRDNNLQHLTWFVCAVTGMNYETIFGYVSELAGDSSLLASYSKAVRESDRRRLADNRVQFGRRLGWYALVRALKPEVVVETGTDKGLGSLVLASALLKNGSGRLITIDINPAAGYLITDKYKEVTTLEFGDSVSIIRNLKDKVNFFLHDSDHSPSHERLELEAIAPLLSSRATVLSDNAHVTDVLARWARENSRQFLFFAEQPNEHWYRGAGIGVAW